MIEADDCEPELEEQFILRLPLREAEDIRELIRFKPEKLRKTLKIALDVTKGSGMVNVGKTKLNAYLKKFPTIIESYKTNIENDETDLYKTANVSHILECVKQPIEHFKRDSPHGYTPPLKNVKNKRFRKTLVNTDVAEETEVITKELYYLLSTDLDAVSTRFELVYEKNGNHDSGLKNDHIEKMLFGHVSTSDSESEIDVV